MATKLSQIYKEWEPENKLRRTIRNCLLLSLWQEVADERLRKHAEPIKILNRTLYLATSNSAWAQELSFLKREIVIKFNKVAGEEVIQDIRFKTMVD